MENKEIEHLGYTISGQGVSAKDDLVKSIWEAPTPKGKDWQMFVMGLIEYY